MRERWKSNDTDRPGDDAGEASFFAAPPEPPPLGDAARDLAIRRLSRQATRFPNMEIAGLDDSHAAMQALTDLDAAFVHAIYDGAVRRWLTLAAIVGRYTSQPLNDMEGRMQGALMAAASQMILLDRVPVHAIINQAVEWCKVKIRPGAGTMANAVLRRVASIVYTPSGDKVRRERWTGLNDEIPLEDGTALAFGEAFLPDDEIDRIAVATSHPAPILRAWSNRFSLTELRTLALHGIASPPVILNVAHAHTPITEFVLPHEKSGHAVFTGSRPALRKLLEERPDVWVQDPAAGRAVRSIADLNIGSGLIIDICAGRGTKTRQLAAIFPSARIVATDMDASRRETLAKVFSASPQVTVVPHKELRQKYIEKADMILLDVPCSNTGVFARRPEAKYRHSAASLESLTNIQRQIIADAIPLLSVGSGGGGRKGRILYSTCSLEVEENEKIADWAKQWHHFRRETETPTIPAGGIGEPSTRYTDGAYSTLLA